MQSFLRDCDHHGYHDPDDHRGFQDYHNYHGCHYHDDHRGRHDRDYNRGCHDHDDHFVIIIMIMRLMLCW